MYQVTVALSVYNVAVYVRSSLESILAQTLKDFEILCIDDASTDGTWDILQEYADQDNRIRLIRQEKNQGLSVSRNLAIREAKGEYLLMLDGDDLFAPDMLEKSYKIALETGADMVLWDYVAFYDERMIPEECAKSSSLLHIDVKDKLQLLRRPAFTATRLLRVSKIKDLNVHFPEGLTKQDIPVHWKLVTSLDKITVIPEFFLFYRQQPNSTSNLKDRSVYSLAYVMDIVKKQLILDGVFQIYKDEFLRLRLVLLWGMYDAILPEFKAEAMEKVKERIGDDEVSYLSSTRNELSSRLKTFYQMIYGNPWAKFKYSVFLFVRDVFRKIKK